MVFLLFDQLGPEYIFIKDGAKVYARSTRLPRLQHRIRGFSWPPSSPDLNPIKKVWRWMKEELKKLPYILKNKADMCKEL